MKDVVNTLNLLANVANSEATVASKKKDAANQARAKALYAKQAQLASLVSQLQKTEAALKEFEDIGEPSLHQLFESITKEAQNELAPLAKLRHPNPKLVQALDDAQFSRNVAGLDQALQGVKRNLELRKTAVKYFLETEETNEKVLEEKMAAYAKRAKEDAALGKELHSPHFVAKLNNANQEWAKVLEKDFNVKNLAENSKPAPVSAVKADPLGNLMSTLVNGLSDLFKDLAASDGSKESFNKPMMGFVGKMIPAVIGLFAGMFKSFFGGTPAQNDKSAEDLTTNISQFFTKQLNKKSTDFTPKKTKLSSSAPNLGGRNAPTFTPAANNFKNAGKKPFTPVPVLPAPGNSSRVSPLRKSR
ncbi:MAG: hypothetical protein JSS07_00740 [Proteobacteria bacterium]|nr:hypothetical protein [Pseudomonadota bacterium]